MLLGVLAGHLPFVILRGGDAESLHSLDDGSLDEFHRFKAAIDLLGKNKCETFLFVLACCQFSVAEIQQH